MSSQNNLADLIVSKIIEINGVGSVIYGLCGGTTCGVDKALQDSIDKKLLTYFHISNESSGVTIASYQAKLNNKVGICFVTAGPGISSALTGISNAYSESNPCIIFTGKPTNSNMFNRDFAITKSVSNEIFIIDNVNKDCGEIIDNAFQTARCGTISNPKPGPVIIFVNTSLWLNPVPKQNLSKTNIQCEWNQDLTVILLAIRATIGSNSKVLLKIGQNVSISNIKRLVELTNKFKNFYVLLTFHSKVYFNSINKKYPNVGVEGYLGNPYTNSNYKEATVIIEFGVIYDEVYDNSLINYINTNILLKDDIIVISPNTKQWYVINGYSTYTPKYISMNNSIVTKCDYFIDKWLEDVELNYPLPLDSAYWINNSNKKNLYWWKVLNQYKYQNENNILTTGSVIAQCLETIYKLQKKNYYALIDDNIIYATDVGISSYIFTQLLSHAKPNHLLSYYDIAPIGIGPAGLAGYLSTGQFSDAVFVIGDGGFSNSPGYFIDLVNIIGSGNFPNMRVLILFMNDYTYTLVENSEIEILGKPTSITSTQQIQKYINYFNLLKSLLGKLLVNSIEITNLSKPDDGLKNFVTGWYNKEAGFTNGGFYILNYNTSANSFYYIYNGNKVP